MNQRDSITNLMYLLSQDIIIEYAWLNKPSLSVNLLWTSLEPLRKYSLKTLLKWFVLLDTVLQEFGKSWVGFILSVGLFLFKYYGTLVYWRKNVENLLRFYDFLILTGRRFDNYCCYLHKIINKQNYSC